MSRFLAASTRKALPFFQLLKKNTKFEWTTEYEQAFQHFKEYLASGPILCKPKEGKSFFLYLSINEDTIAAALVKKEGQDQKPMYFFSKVLQGPEI